MRTTGALLVVAGEASGDAWASGVVSALGVRAFGLGGPELFRAGTELVSDARSFSAMGFSAPLRSAPELLRALAALVRAVRSRRPAAALLVGFSEVNARLARWLKWRRVRVLWYAPPQVWAWRERRAPRIARAVERLAVILPFETNVWRRAGARVDYVGHPALDQPSIDARTRPGATIALLPGSRRHEVRAHLETMLDGVACAGSLAARLVLSRGLPAETSAWARRRAEARGAAVHEGPLEAALSGARLAVVASGTATLECALHGVPPVIVYRTDRLTHAIARRLVRVSSIGLPNLVLGRPVFPELIQDAVTPSNIKTATERVLHDERGFEYACAEIRETLAKGLGPGTTAERVARLVEPWLS